MTLPIHPAVEAFASQLGEDCGVTPTVEHVSGRRWRVTVTNPRVSMWVEYDVLSRGRLSWSQSQLFVDGEMVERADSYRDFLDIFRDPDGTSPEPVPELHDVDPNTAPEPVRRAWVKVSAILQKTSPGQWHFGVRHGGRAWLIVGVSGEIELRFRFRPAADGPQAPAAGSGGQAGPPADRVVHRRRGLNREDQRPPRQGPSQWSSRTPLLLPHPGSPVNAPPR